MIIQLRIDDRLIHGQVALVWSKELGTPGIIVANDQAPGIKLIVKSVDDAVGVIQDPRAEKMRIFALTRNVKDALKLVKSCKENICEVNLANAGKFDSDMGEKINFPGNRVSLTPSELEAAKELAAIMGDHFFSQLIPTTPKVTVSNMIQSLEK